MVRGILGTSYEDRWMLGKAEINSIDDIIHQTGKPYVKAKFLSRAPELSNDLTETAISDLKKLVETEVKWENTQLLGVACLSPQSGYMFLQLFSEEFPIETAGQYHWRKFQENPSKTSIKQFKPPIPCTRELEIIEELTEIYSKLIRTNCTDENLISYAQTWPEDRKLI